MRSKKLYMLFLAAVAINVVIFLRPIPMLKNIVHETNQKISNINVFKMTDQDTDQTYLEYLGVLEENNSQSRIQKSLVVASAVSSYTYDIAFDFIKSINESLDQVYESVILFDIGLKSWHINQLSKNCTTLNKCIIKHFDFEKFPKHIANIETKAYKPLLIQMLMQQFEVVLWMDLSSPQYLPIPGNLNRWKHLLKNLTSSGIKGWPVRWPTSSVTHPEMFQYFHINPEKFYFYPMITTKFFLIQKSEKIIRKIMLPWIQCVLNERCIRPASIDTKSTGCNFDKQPHFIYSGCHWTEMSALNIVIGLYFNMSILPYTLSTKPYTINEMFYFKTKLLFTINKQNELKNEQDKKQQNQNIKSKHNPIGNVLLDSKNSNSYDNYDPFIKLKYAF